MDKITESKQGYKKFDTKIRMLAALKENENNLKAKLHDLYELEESSKREQYALEISQNTMHNVRWMTRFASTGVACWLGTIVGVITKGTLDSRAINANRDSVLKAQQDYTNQITSDLYNQFSVSFVPDPSSIYAQILHYSESPIINKASSLYFSDYAYNVKETLKQITLDVAGANFGGIALGVGVGAGVATLACHVIGSKIFKFNKKKKIENHKKFQACIREEINEKTIKHQELKEFYKDIEYSDIPDNLGQERNL